MIKIREILREIELLAPLPLQESFDNAGVQVGDVNQFASGALLCLDVTEEVIEEAIDRGCNLIISHHPLAFRPFKSLTGCTYVERCLMKACKHDLVVYAAHTNLDNANGGMNDWLAAQLELTNVEPLQITGIDPISGRDYGMGRLGDLLQPMSPAAFGQWCLEKFQLNGARLIVNPDDQKQLIKRVAILGGSGQDFWQLAKKRGADAYVTGDVSYHFAHDMIASHLTVVDAGHHIEAVCQDQLASLLKKWRQENDWDFEIITSEINTEPFKFIVK